MKGLIILIAAVSVCLISANASFALRCGNTFVKEGAKSVEIFAACGEPKLREVIKAGGKSGDVTERWTYGPYKGYYYFLYFKAGVLDRIDSKKQ